MSEATHVVAVSGGKDSTVLALRLAEVAPRDYVYFSTPTGDELPEMVAHWERIEELLGKKLVRLTNGTLYDCIERNGALPNHRMRFCTRELKIVPCLAFMKRFQNPVLYVGLRADEEERKGIFSNDIETRFPFREWGWRLNEVVDYLKKRGVKIPKRTDCALCYHQRLGEWRDLWKHYPNIYERGIALEEKYGRTFRSPKRDTKPAELLHLKMIFEHDPNPPEDEEDNGNGPCRVCSL